MSARDDLAQALLRNLYPAGTGPDNAVAVFAAVDDALAVEAAQHTASDTGQDSLSPFTPENFALLRENYRLAVARTAADQAALVALREERDEALRQLDEDDDARAERVLNETSMIGMGPDPEGGWSVRAQPPHWLVVTMAAALARSMTDDVPNYTETAFTFTPAPAGEVAKFSLTVQRVRGKTAHELRREAEAERDALAASLARVQEALNDGPGATIAAEHTDNDEGCCAACGQYATCDALAFRQAVRAALSPAVPEEGTA